MIKQDIPIHKLDLTAKSPFNRISGQYMSRKTVTNNNIVIPPGAPFYQDTFRMYDVNGTPLTEGEDYEFYGMMGKLTQYTGNRVGLFVRLKKDELIEWMVDYQVVGNFNKLTNNILNMLRSIYEDDRYVMYKDITNKPLWFIPEIHKHDLAYDIFGFTDLVRELQRVSSYAAAVTGVADEMLNIFAERLDSYIKAYKEVLVNLINSHNANQVDAHGVNKDQIGLGLVDNYLTATLEETLEGVRDDLFVTPYTAAQAAVAAAGRNDKLFPSGTLPLLRYGSDTFIPPTISGSFEGMGGLYQHIAAVIENDGTLLVLQRRNNGKVKGLYFLRSINWSSNNPNWEFTAYTYQHPTATAAGANLNHVINGSNDQFMIVGDEDKNIWFWCETKGTLNPDRHVLHRVSNADWLANNKDFNRAFIMTPNDPSDCVMVVFGLNHEQLKVYRPNLSPPSETGQGSRVQEGFLFFVLVADDFRQAKMTYSTAAGKQFTNDPAFVPYERIPALGPNGEKGLSEYHVKWKNPIAQSWAYRMLQGFCDKTSIPGTYDMLMSFHIWSRSFAGKSFFNTVPYRAKIKVTKGITPLIEFTPGDGEKKLYTLDIDNPTSSADYSDYMKWKNLRADIFNNTEFQGFSNLHDGKIIYLGSYGGFYIPVAPFIGTLGWLESPNGLVNPLSSSMWTQRSGSVSKEYNPVGLGSLFINQVHLSMDTDDWRQAAVMARQVNANLETEWICRPMSFLTSDWRHGGSRSVMNLSGKSVNYYPYVSTIYKTNIGPQLVMNISGLDPVNPRASERYKQIFGCDAWSTLDGKITKGTKGDGLLVRKNKIKLVDNVVTFTPTIVYNVGKSIDRDFKPKLAAAGIDVTEVGNSWTLIQILTANQGNEYHLFQAAEISNNGKNVRVAAVLCNVTGKGTPVTKDGYQYYDDVNIAFTSAVNIIVYDTDAIFSGFNPSIYAGGDVYGHSSVCLTSGDGSPTATKGTAVVRSLGRYNMPADRSTLDVIYEFKLDGTEILRMANFRQSHVGPENRWTISPGNGQGCTIYTKDLMEGAGIVSQNFNYSSAYSLYDAMFNSTIQEDYQVGMSNLLVPQYVVYFNKMDNVVLAGKQYDIPSTYIDILNQDSNPANKVYYAYLYYSAGKAGYVLTQDVRPETSTQAMIAKIICGPSQIDSIIPYNRFTMDGAQISAVRQGSAILASSGSVFEIGNTANILLDNDFIPE